MHRLKRKSSMKDNRRILNAKLQGRNGHSQSEQKRQNNCVNRLVFYTDYTDRYGQLADMKTYIYICIYIFILHEGQLAVVVVAAAAAAAVVAVERRRKQ